MNCCDEIRMNYCNAERFLLRAGQRRPDLIARNLGMSPLVFTVVCRYPAVYCSYLAPLRRAVLYIGVSSEALCQTTPLSCTHSRSVLYVFYSRDSSHMFHRLFLKHRSTLACGRIELPTPRLPEQGPSASSSCSNLQEGTM
jgi:hypothetical protein